MCSLCRLDALKKIVYNTPEKQAEADTFPLEEWAAEMRLTQQACERLPSPVVWCHIDLLSGNILVDKKVCIPLLHSPTEGAAIIGMHCCISAMRMSNCSARVLL
jgi:thiamine kinase-like enzyme